MPVERAPQALPRPRPIPGKGEIKSLTSLRGLAAMAVVLTHFSSTAQQHSSGWIPSIVPHGYMAVDFFFVLSGFIMSYTYLSAFDRDGMGAYGPFLWKRVARIFPLGIAVTAFILLCGAVAGIWGLSDLFINGNARNGGLGLATAVNILHLQGPLNYLNLNDPSWSVSVELGAYLLFPIFIALVFRGSGLQFALVASVAVLALIGMAVPQPRLAMPDRGPWMDFARCCVGFVLGMATYRLYLRAAVTREIGRDRWTWLISAACVGALCIRVDLLAALCFPAVILTWSLNDGRASRLMSSRVPYFLGMISFSIYLVHHLFRHPELELLKHVFPAPVPPWAALAFALAGSLSVLPLSALAYYWVERPGRSAVAALQPFLRTRVRP